MTDTPENANLTALLNALATDGDDDVDHTPNFEARITAAEKVLTDELDTIARTMNYRGPSAQVLEGIRAIQTVCAVVRDYARRAEGE